MISGLSQGKTELGAIRLDSVVFFNAPGIEKLFSKADIDFQKAAGALVRRLSRDSIRFRKKKISLPGQPPRQHTRVGLANIKKIIFAYDPSRKTTIVGPIKFPGSKKRKKGQQARAMLSKPVPSILEHGGYSYAGKKQKRVRVRKRPYMLPALQSARPAFAKMYRESVRINATGYRYRARIIKQRKGT